MVKEIAGNGEIIGTILTELTDKGWRKEINESLIETTDKLGEKHEE